MKFPNFGLLQKIQQSAFIVKNTTIVKMWITRELGKKTNVENTTVRELTVVENTTVKKRTVVESATVGLVTTINHNELKTLISIYIRMYLDIVRDPDLLKTFKSLRSAAAPIF